MTKSTKPVNVKLSILFSTSAIVSVTTLIIDNIFELINKNIFSKSYKLLADTFFTKHPVYFPLIYLIAAFLMTLCVVYIYSLLRERMPSGWVIPGIIIGIILFLVADLPGLIQLGYITILPGDIARGMGAGMFFSSVVNGIILCYVYHKLLKNK